jgi:RES domain-containing protein
MPVFAWRITTKREVSAAFDGEGARLYGGGWNRRGTPMVYASEHLSRASSTLIPKTSRESFFRFPVELPDDAVEALPRGLRASWRDYPAPDDTAVAGTEWVRRGGSVALLVPSAVVPEEHNVLLNPGHPRFGEVRIAPGETFSFDPRMWKGDRRCGGDG